MLPPTGPRIQRSRHSNRITPISIRKKRSKESQRGIFNVEIRRIFVPALFFLTPIARADLFLPDGLNPGDEYRIVFRTSPPVRTLATFGSISHYNNLANTTGNTAGTLTSSLNTNWTAIVSTAGDTEHASDARDNTSTNLLLDVGVPIYLVDGATRIANNNADLWDGDIAAPIVLDEFGNDIPPGFYPFVWTGTDLHGFGLATMGTSDPTSRVGRLGVSTAAWISGGDLSNSTDNSLGIYVISDTLVAVPEPLSFPALGLMFVGLVSLVRPTRKRNRSIRGAP